MNPIHHLARRRWLIAAASFAAAPAAWAQGGFDHQHADWTALLRKHVALRDGGKASRVRYAAFAADRVALKKVLDAYSAVKVAEFDAWSKPQRMAFLINAYNAFTIELILTRYPKLESIKDIGTLLTNPWKQKFVPLLGATITLDDIEHGMLRKRGAYDDPRIHFAVNCASIGCPMLREEAFVAERLEAQLDEQALRFMADRNRNRLAGGKLEVSKIFDWYGEDFRLGHRGIGSLPAFLARYADQLADAPADREAVRGGKLGIEFLGYDWKLNDAR
jgi:hypothetical protein